MAHAYFPPANRRCIKCFIQPLSWQKFLCTKCMSKKFVWKYCCRFWKDAKPICTFTSQFSLSLNLFLNYSCLHKPLLVLHGTRSHFVLLSLHKTNMVQNNRKAEQKFCRKKWSHGAISQLNTGLEIGYFEKNSKLKKNTQQLKEKTQGLGKFLPSSGTKPCVLPLKTHSSWWKLKVYVI